MDKDEPVDIDDLRDMMLSDDTDTDREGTEIHDLAESDGEPGFGNIVRDDWREWNWRVESDVWIVRDDI